jgi:hypothetical protein
MADFTLEAIPVAVNASYVTTTVKVMMATAMTGRAAYEQKVPNISISFRLRWSLDGVRIGKDA